MDCLLNYIGIRHCSQDTPDSGVYINSLPGMSTELADKIANSEQITFGKVWEDVQSVAFLRLVQDVQKYLLEFGYTGFNKTIYQTQNLRKPRNYQNLDVDINYRGVYFNLPISRFVKVQINEVQIFIRAFDPLITHSVKIFDLQSEVELQNIEFIPVIGLNTIPVNLEVNINTESIELFVGFDSTDIETIVTTNDLYGWYPDSECQHNSGWGGTDEYSIIAPAKMGIGSELKHSSVTFPGIGQGIAVDAQVLCSLEQFICENKRHLINALLYLLGSQMLFQKLASNIGSRVNWFTYGNMEQTSITRNQFEIEYVKSIKNAVRGLNIPDSGLCFECGENAPSQEAYAMP